jgi:hypothetical protein
MAVSRGGARVGPRPALSGRRASSSREALRPQLRCVHDDYYDHDDAPPRVVKTIIRDSDNTQWSVLTKINYAEWSSMTKVKLEA